MRERVCFSRLFEPEPVSELEPLELVADNALEGGPKEGAGVGRLLHEAAKKHVDVGDGRVETLQAGNELKKKKKCQEKGSPSDVIFSEMSEVSGQKNIASTAQL